jgi:glycosyltransferase involved in cell wall biosynthesis
MKIVLTKRELLDVPDGISIFIFSLADELMRLGHEVIVVTSAPFEKAKICDFFRFSRSPELLALRARRESGYAGRTWTWLREGLSTVNLLRPELVIVNGALPVRFRSATCTISHDLEQRVPGAGFFRVAYKRYAYGLSDYVVATCSELKEALSTELAVGNSHISVIPTCVNTNGYLNRPLPQRERAILHLGTARYKNPFGTIRAFARLKSSTANLYVTGPTTGRVSRCVRDLVPGVRERIHLLGYVPAAHLKELLGRVRVVSVPSQYHVPVASPSVLESFASGTPVIGSPSISHDLLVDNLNGYVRQPATPDELVEAMRSLLDDDTTWTRMAGAAVSTAQGFSSENVARAYLALVN